MPPGVRDVPLATEALKNILICHGKAYDFIHSRVPGAMVSVAHNMAAFVPWNRWNPADRLLSVIAGRFYNHSLLEACRTGTLRHGFSLKKAAGIPVPVRGRIDFFGVNYCTRLHLRFNPFKKGGWSRDTGTSRVGD